MSKSPNLRPLSNDLAKKAKDELNEDPSRIQSDLETFRSWINKQPHLRARTDDQFLITFLRACKYSIEKAKEKFDLYHTVRSALPEFFANRDPNNPRIIETLRQGACLGLPRPICCDGPVVCITRTASYDPKKFNITDISIVAGMIFDILFLESDNGVISGFEYIINGEKITAAHVFQHEPAIFKKLLVFYQKASPVRIKGIHFINTPTIFQQFVNFLYSLLNNKIKTRTHFYGTNYEDLYNYIPKDILPKEYGGTGQSVDELLKYWEKKFFEYREFFIEESSKYGCDEKLRPGKAKTQETLFGLDGTFRSLNVD